MGFINQLVAKKNLLKRRENKMHLHKANDHTPVVREVLDTSDHYRCGEESGTVGGNTHEGTHLPERRRSDPSSDGKPHHEIPKHALHSTNGEHQPWRRHIVHQARHYTNRRSKGLEYCDRVQSLLVVTHRNLQAL